MKEIDSLVVIIKYYIEEEKIDIIVKNKVGVDMIVKNTLLNFRETVLNYL